MSSAATSIPAAATAGAFLLQARREGYGPGRAGRQALLPGSAAVIRILNHCLAIDDLIKTLAAGIHAGPAPSAEFGVNEWTFCLHVNFYYPL
jgi:hypothetical protein